MIKPFLSLKVLFKDAMSLLKAINDALYFYIHLKKLFIGIHKKKMLFHNIAALQEKLLFD